MEKKLILPSIKWREWQDPFRPVVEAYNKAMDNDDLEDNDEDGDGWKNKYKAKYKGPVLVGNFGYIPLSEATLPSTQWTFWVGDCNFDITREIYDAMVNTSGVDIFRQWTRYRFWLGVGSNFESADVKKEIEENAFKAASFGSRVSKGIQLPR